MPVSRAPTGLLAAAATDSVLLSVKNMGCSEHNSSAILTANWTLNASACRADETCGDIAEMKLLLLGVSPVCCMKMPMPAGAEFCPCKGDQAAST
jgi:hypothetical protein